MGIKFTQSIKSAKVYVSPEPDGDWAWYHDGVVWSAHGYIGRAVAACMEA